MRMIKHTVENKTIKEGYDEFIKYCKAKNLSEYTIKYYQVSFGMFMKFKLEKDLIYEIRRETINNFIFYLRETTNYNDISINTTLRGLRTILHYWMELEYLKRFKIELIKAEKKIKQTYSDAELESLLKRPNIGTCHFGEYRNWVIANFLMATGCRASTIINVKLKDIDFENDMIYLDKTKNRKQQIIPMSSSLIPILKEYIEYRNGEQDEYLFSDIWGGQLSVKGLQSSIRYYNNGRGVTKTSIHLYRHTFAKKWILAGGDIFRLQKILGHNSLEMVKNYVNMFSNDLQKDFNTFSPLEQMQSRNNKKHIKMR